jgi:tyrosyl-tRNA synthetase
MIDFADGKAIQVNNADWLLDLNYVNFLRDVGVHFSVNRMLAAECYKARLERGLSFFEMNYMIMQAYDFLYLNRNYGVTLEMGGDDQWSNMIAGVELTRRADAKEVYAATSGLLLTSEGKKMGKTERGAVWISAARMAPYDFYQYWRNVDDADVISCLKMLTFLPLEQIAEYAKRSGAALNEVKAILAYETTALIHGEAEAEKAKAAAKNLFGGAGTSADAPETSLTEADFDANGQIDICTALVKAGLAKSKSDARRLIEQSSVYADSDKITTIAYTFNAESLRTNPVLLRKGKKGYSRLTADG